LAFTASENSVRFKGTGGDVETDAVDDVRDGDVTFDEEEEEVDNEEGDEERKEGEDAEDAGGEDGWPEGKMEEEELVSEEDEETEMEEGGGEFGGDGGSESVPKSVEGEGPSWAKYQISLTFQF